MRRLAGKTIDSKEKNVPSTKATLCEEGKTSSILNSVTKTMTESIEHYIQKQTWRTLGETGINFITSKLV